MKQSFIIKAYWLYTQDEKKIELQLINTEMHFITFLRIILHPEELTPNAEQTHLALCSPELSFHHSCKNIQ